MGSPVYSNVNPQASLGIDMFSQAEINMVDGILSNLKSGKSVSSSDLENSTMILASRRNHPLYGQACDEIASAMFAYCPTPASQADIVGPLVAPENVDLVTNLLNIPDNSLAVELGPDRVKSLVEAAQAPTEPVRTAILIQAAQEHLGRVPGKYEDESRIEQQTTQSVAGEDIGGWLTASLAEAIEQGDAPMLEMTLNGLPSTSLPELSNRIAQIGEPARPILQVLVNSPDARTSEFAFSTLLQIGNANLPSDTNTAPSDYRDEMRSAGALDMHSLESLLMAPENTIANLSKQLAGVPGVNARLIKLMIR